MAVLMQTNGFLVLRDGRPFGDLGIIDSYSRQWPLPQTIAGMIRTKIGFAIKEDFFESAANCETILQVGLESQIPLLEDGRFLAPVPADLVFSQEKNIGEIKVNIPLLGLDKSVSGTDIVNSHWLIPSLDLKDKPAKEKPFFLYWDQFEKYINEDLEGSAKKIFEFGCSSPITDFRLHNSINEESFTTQQGQLFSNNGIYMQATTESNTKQEVKLLITIKDKLLNLDFTGSAYLGGERKTVSLQNSEVEFPTCPNIFKDKKFLKLILSTHGEFGSWCPEWLKPDLESDDLPWVEVPNSSFKVKLRTAYINGYANASGWDYVKKAPKANRKLVLPGAVYVIELENESESEKVAELFWGRHLDPANNETNLNGYGQTLVGNITIK